jgi:hypothetical protein
MRCASLPLVVLVRTACSSPARLNYGDLSSITSSVPNESHHPASRIHAGVDAIRVLPDMEFVWHG